MRVIVASVVLLLGAACPLPTNVLYRCEPDFTCAQPNHLCRFDGYCYPATERPDAGSCVPMDLEALCASAECGFVRDGCGRELDCHKRCTDARECGVEGPNRCAYPSLCTAEGWCWEHPSPQGLTLNAGFRLDARHTWWVGENHVVLFFDGERSSLQDNPGSFGDELLAVHGSAPDEVFAVGESGLILHFDGTSWERESTPTPLTSVLRTVVSLGDGGAVAAGPQGRVISRTPSTSPFTRWAIETFPVTNDVRAVFTANDTLYAVTRNSELFARPISMPSAWERLDTVPLQETHAAMARGDGLLFGGTSGSRDTLLQRDPDGGWRSLVDGGGISVTGLVPADGGVFVIGANVDQGFLDDADTFSRLTPELGPWNTGVAHDGPVLELGGALGSQALLDLDGGFTWLSSPRPTPGLHLNAVCGASPGTLTAAGGTDTGQGAVKWLSREATAAGARWKVNELMLGNTTKLLGCFAESGRTWLPGNDTKYVFLTPNGAEAGDFGGAVAGQYRSAWGTPDAGYYFVRDSAELTFSSTGVSDFQITRGAPSALRAVWGLDETDFVTVGAGGFFSSWSPGMTESQQLANGAVEWLTVHGVRLASGERRYVAGGTNGTVFSLVGDAGMTTQLNPATTFTASWVAPNGTAWAAGARDGGAVMTRQELDGGWAPEFIQLPRGVTGLVGFEREDGGVRLWFSGPSGAVLRKDTR